MGNEQSKYFLLYPSECKHGDGPLGRSQNYYLRSDMKQRPTFPQNYLYVMHG